MNLFRKTVFWLHLAAGLLAGLVILLMCVTGVVLTYEQQIIRWVDRDLRVSPPSADAPRLSVEELLAKAGETMGTAPTDLVVYRNPSLPPSITFGRQGSQFVDPYTAKLLGPGNPTVRAFMRSTMEWHRYIALKGDQRPLGKAITGACNLAFLFLIVSGFYLWWPRNWKWPAFKGVLFFRPGLKGKARDFNWHNVAGVWTALPLFLVVITATPFGYQWANNLVFRLAGDQPPPPRPPAPPQNASPANPSTRPAEPRRPEPKPVLANLNRHWAKAEQHRPGWTSIGLKVPTSTMAPIEFALDTGEGRQPQHKSTLFLNASTGEIEKDEVFASLPPGRRLRSLTRFIHTGEVWGVVGQTIAGIATAAGALLVYTGFALAFRRFFFRSKDRATSAESVVNAEPATASASR